MNIQSLLCVFLFLSFFQNTSAQSLTESEINKINQYIVERIGKDDPGIAYGIVRNGKIELEEYHGLANLQHQIPVTEQTKFNIASVSKQFTALMVLDLALKGTLNLDDDIRKFIPDIYPDIKAPIRVRHVLNHSSGIRDYPDLLSLQRKPWWRQVGYDNDDALELLLSQKELNFAPGSAYVYSNSNYTLLTHIIEKASATPFHEYARTFFDRMGMTHSQFNKSYMGVIPYVSLPYSDWGNGIWQQYPQLTNLYGDGFLFTTLKDLLTYEMAIQKAKEPNNQLLYLSQKPIEDAEISSYGFGLELGSRNGIPAVHHSGLTGSFHAQVVRYPEQNLSIVIMSNNSRIWSGNIADEITSIVMPDQSQLSANPTFDSSQYAEPLPSESMVGDYLSEQGFIVRIEQKNDTLLWISRNRNPLPLVPESGSVYFNAYYPSQKTAFRDNQIFLYSPDEEPRIHNKLPSFSPDINYKKQLTGRYYNEELDITLQLSLDEKGALTLFNNLQDRSYSGEVIQKDFLQISDYSIKVHRDDQQAVESLLLSYARLRNIRFNKLP